MAADIWVVEPPVPIVTLDDARRHLAELPEEDEAYVEGLILAATTWIDGPTGWLGRALGIQTLDYAMEDFYSDADGYIHLPFSPVLELVSIRVRASADRFDTLPSSEYEIDAGGVYPLSGAWPFVSGRNQRVIIRYRVGCAKTVGTPAVWVANVPEPIRFAILLLVAHWYRNREAVVIGQSAVTLPFAVDALLQPYRIYR
ncbi:head-tail connector protein [Rhizobium sp. SGZ-381]|uniref:head-tail connector protein n=1 Tax=Rhizobium sp. SGZ-381 TaxID=3342800 RepID=UPI00366CD0AA